MGKNAAGINLPLDETHWSRGSGDRRRLGLGTGDIGSSLCLSPGGFLGHSDISLIQSGPYQLVLFVFLGADNTWTVAVVLRHYIW